MSFHKFIDEKRVEIDAIDKQMAELYEKRMLTALEIGRYKAEREIPICDEKRENEIKKTNAAIIKDDMIRKYYDVFIDIIIRQSKDYQVRTINEFGM